MAKKKAAKKARAKFPGKKPMQLWWDDDERFAIACAAAAKDWSMTRFVQNVALAEARRICAAMDKKK